MQLLCNLSYSRDDDLPILAKILTKNKVLETLKLSNNGITLTGKNGKLFTGALVTSSTLQNLWLRNNNVGDVGADNLARALKTNNTIKCMLLTGNNIRYEGAESLAGSFLENDTLESISLSENPIGFKGVESIATALESEDCTLKTLYLNSTKICDEGSKLAEKLKDNNSIEHMELACNSITYIGAECLESALADNHKLEKLSLANNDIGNEGAGHFAAALMMNNHLKVLDLSSNNIGKDGTDALAESFRSNKTLERLNFSNNEIGDQEARACFAAALDDNNVVKIQLGDNTKNAMSTHHRRRKKASDDNIIHNRKKKKKSRLMDEMNLPQTSLELSLQVKTKSQARALTALEAEMQEETVKVQKEAREEAKAIAERAKECPICFEVKDENYALDPCGHILCLDCKDLISTCPTCQTAISGRIRLYMD